MSQIILNNCRLCYNRNGINEFLNNVDFITQVFQCTNIKLNEEIKKDLPKTVCEVCKNTIETFYKYVIQIRKTDDYLKNCVKLIKVKHNDKTKKFKCDDCSKTYARSSNLQAHKLMHNKLYCKQCKVTFMSDLQYEEHSCLIPLKKLDCKNEMAHIENKLERNDSLHLEGQVENDIKDTKLAELFMCKWPNCNKAYSTSYTLKTHELKHEGKRRFLCVTCGKRFLTKNSLNCHEKIHLDVKGYVCKLCNIGFSVRSNLRSHEKKHHEGIRFYCSKCTRAFISKSSLERHEKLHTGIKEFKCNDCPSAFYTNKELMKHKRYHQGLRQYKCDECFKTFFEKHHLVIHTRSHTGERPYVCKVFGCNKSFAESQKLNRHVKARHPPL